MDIEDIAAQVQGNCDLSDAKHWGSYTICGLLLRLMDLYRWSEGLEPWTKLDNSELMDWVGEKEKGWEKIRENEYKNIVIEGKEYDLFDAEGINELLEPEGFVYGAGYVTAMKPSFFLAEKEESRLEDGHRIFILGKELARDLITTPALLLEKNIFLRTQPARSFIWHKIAEFKFSGKESLKRAFAYYGVDLDDINAEGVDSVVREELESYIHHEIGEANETAFPDGKWGGDSKRIFTNSHRKICEVAGGRSGRYERARHSSLYDREQKGGASRLLRCFYRRIQEADIP